MANFEGTVPTARGLILLGKIGTGVKLNFTRVAVGSGLWTSEQVSAPAKVTALVKEEMTLAISPDSVKAKAIPEGDEPVGCYSLRVMLTNSGLSEGFALRELGLFAEDPDLGEILFAVDYAGDLYDFIPALPANAAPMEKIFNLDFLTGNAKEIYVNQSPVLLATVDDISDHNEDPTAHADLLTRLATGIPEIISPANNAEDIGETPLFLFKKFESYLANTAEDAIQLQVDMQSGNFENPVHDTGWLTTILSGYVLPPNLLIILSYYKAKIRRRLKSGQISPWSEIVLFSTREIFNYVVRPTNIEPVAGATGVGECPTFVGSAFTVVGDVEDTHEATRGYILKDGVVLYDTGELGPVTEFTPPPGYHNVSEDYEFQMQYKGKILGWGERSAATSYRTAAAFITGDEAVYPQSWDSYENASAAGVALDDDAELYSAGVDQDAEDGDWLKYSVRAKVRGGELSILSSTPTEIQTDSKIYVGQTLITNLGECVVDEISDGAETVFVSNLADVTSAYVDIAGNGKRIGLPITPNFSAILRKLRMKFWKGDTASVFKASIYSDNNGKLGNRLTEYGAAVQTFDGIVEMNLPEYRMSSCKSYWVVAEDQSANGDGVYKASVGPSCWVDGVSENVCLAFELTALSQIVDISSAGFTQAPTKVFKKPTIKAATGPVGTAFTAADFNEIEIKSATLGTDNDSVRHDFILLDSEKITPAEPFRRVALGLSGLSKDSETRISETQINTWKQGA